MRNFSHARLTRALAIEMASLMAPPAILHGQAPQQPTNTQTLRDLIAKRDEAKAKLVEAAGKRDQAKNAVANYKKHYESWAKQHKAEGKEVESWSAELSGARAQNNTQLIQSLKAYNFSDARAFSDEVKAGADLLQKMEEEQEKLNAAEKKASEASADMQGAQDDINAVTNQIGLPPWFGVYLMTGTNDLFKSQVGDSNSRVDGLLIEVGGVDPQRFKPGTLFRQPGYHLVGITAGLFNADPVVAKREESGNTITSTNYKSRARVELNFREMFWNCGFTKGWGTATTEDQQKWAAGVFLAVGRGYYDSNLVSKTTQTNGILVQETSNPESSQVTMYRGAVRIEFTPSSRNAYSGSFFEIGYMHDPTFIERSDRIYFDSRLVLTQPGSTDEKKANHFFIEFKYQGGYGQRDSLGVFFGYQANFSDLLAKLTPGK